MSLEDAFGPVDPASCTPFPRRARQADRDTARMWCVEISVWFENDIAAAILARAAARGVTIGDVVAEAWESFAGPGDP